MLFIASVQHRFDGARRKQTSEQAMWRWKFPIQNISLVFSTICCLSISYFLYVMHIYVCTYVCRVVSLLCSTDNRIGHDRWRFYVAMMSHTIVQTHDFNIDHAITHILNFLV